MTRLTESRRLNLHEQLCDEIKNGTSTPARFRAAVRYLRIGGDHSPQHKKPRKDRVDTLIYLHQLHQTGKPTWTEQLAYVAELKSARHDNSENSSTFTEYDRQKFLASGVDISASLGSSYVHHDDIEDDDI